MKKFIITIDTEGDNLWRWKREDQITTKNTLYLERFQTLCNKYGFKPVWLSNWEMINNATFVDFINKHIAVGECELGMHLHAWNNPPIYELPHHDHSGAPYLIEYPTDVMEEKIAAITNRMRQQFGFVPLSHRAGRWAMNEKYFKLLYQYGYRIDCSYTPGINWSDSVGQTEGFAGPDYRKVLNKIHTYHGVIEVPVTVEYTHRIFIDAKKSVKSNVKAIIFGAKGQTIWLRPNRENLKELQWMIAANKEGNQDYLMFMLHSSELMPGGSPTFRSEEDIEELYRKLGILFKEIQTAYEGITLEQYVRDRGLLS